MSSPDESNIAPKEIARARILSLLRDHDIKDIEFESIIGLKKNAISEWKRKGSASFIDNLPKIAQYFGVTTDWLLGNEVIDEPDMYDVPIKGVIRAGFPMESFEVDDGKVRLPFPITNAANTFALRVMGDSMSPLILNNDIIIVRKGCPRTVSGKIWLCYQGLFIARIVALRCTLIVARLKANCTNLICVRLVVFLQCVPTNSIKLPSKSVMRFFP